MVNQYPHDVYTLSITPVNMEPACTSMTLWHALVTFILTYSDFYNRVQFTTINYKECTINVFI